MADDGYIRIGADISEAMQFFDNLDVNKKQIVKYLLTAAGKGSVAYVKNNINSIVNRGTGLLKRTIKYKVQKSGKTVVITNDAANANGIRYGFVLAAGWQSPKPGGERKLMTFNINGKWVRTYHTQGKPRDFMEGPVERYVETPDFHNRIDNALQIQIDYWEKRIKEGRT